MGVVDTVKGSMAGKGKVYVIGGAVLGLGYLWWTRVRNATPSGEGDATITAGGSAVADPVTPAGGDYSPATNQTRPSTNGEWLEQAVAILIAPPYNRPAIPTFNALSKALSGASITTAEAAIAELAIQVRGVPPEGMPPLNIAATGSSGGTDNTPAPATPAPIPGFANFYKGQVVDDWVNDLTHRYGIYWGDITRLNPDAAKHIVANNDPRKRVFKYNGAFKIHE